MSQDEVALNGEEIKPVSLAIIKLCLSERISQLVESIVVVDGLHD